MFWRCAAIHPRGQSAFTAVEGGFRYAAELVAFIRETRGPKLCVGGAAYPEKHIECGNPAVNLNNLKRKADAGLDFLITNLFFDNRHFWELVERARAVGIRNPHHSGHYADHECRSDRTVHRFLRSDAALQAGGGTRPAP